MSNDTNRDGQDRQHDIFKRMTGEEKVRTAMAFSDVVRDLALAGLRGRYPGASEAQQRALFIKEVHGVEIHNLSGDPMNE